LADDLVDHFSEAVDSCMKLNRSWQLSQHVWAHAEECRLITLHWYSVSMLFNHPTNFWPRIIMSFHYTHKHKCFLPDFVFI